MGTVPSWMWLLLGAALLALEVGNGTFVLAILGVAALATAAATLGGLPPLLQVLAFGLFGAAGLFMLRPLLLRRVRATGAATNVAALPGQTARLVRPFDASGIGRVAVGGEEWRARLAEGWPAGQWAEGSRFTVLRVEGVTLEVCPEDLAAPAAAVPQLRR